jgi:hypothetical protein
MKSKGTKPPRPSNLGRFIFSAADDNVTEHVQHVTWSILQYKNFTEEQVDTIEAHVNKEMKFSPKLHLWLLERHTNNLLRDILPLLHLKVNSHKAVIVFTKFAVFKGHFKSCITMTCANSSEDWFLFIGLT